MSKNTSKLGRNPLETMTPLKVRSLPELKVEVEKINLVEKVRELKVEIYWDELYEATVQQAIRRVGRFFLNF